MAQMFGTSPMLSAVRSPQSGTYTMTAAWQVVYTESCTQPFLFVGANLNLQNMFGGDTIGVRVRKKESSGGSWVNHDGMVYSGVQPANHPSVAIGAVFGMYGIEISMQQTAVAAAFINVVCEFFHAKRIGLS